MIVRVSFPKVFYTLYVIIMCMPFYFSSSIIDLADNIMLLLGIAFLFLIKYKPSRFMMFVFIYFVYLILISFIKDTDAANMYMITSNLKIITFLSVTECFIQKKPKATMNIFLIVILTFVLMDFISIVCFPEGLYQHTYVWNQWSTTYEACWIYGYKNNRIYWYAIMILLVCWRYINTNMHRLVVIAATVLSLTAMILVESDTSAITVGIIAIGIFFFLFRSEKHPVNKLQKKIFNQEMYVVFGIYIILFIMLIGGMMSFLQPVLTSVFKKDLTFSSRTIIWSSVVQLIFQKPIFGWGIMESVDVANILGNSAFTSAHNQILNTIWQGGIVGLILFALIFIELGRKVNSQPDKRIRRFLCLMVFSILFVMLFESVLRLSTTGATWFWLLLCYYFDKVEMNEKLTDN